MGKQALATLPTRGRRLAESPDPIRDDFQRDRDRIIHAAAFRRLEYKTQVFINHEGDHFRTRLTHSLEVGQISRTMARALGLNEDLAEAVALAHDLGHPPFGHAGEDALNKAMQPFGGFDHNDQALRVVTQLENRYAKFTGLNLTWETLEGLVKHNGPLAGAKAKRPLPPYIAAMDKDYALALDQYPSAEAQVAAIADDIAYNSHDVDDGLRAGLFTVEDLQEVPWVHALFLKVREKFPNATASQHRHEAVRRLLRSMVVDALDTSTRLLAKQQSPATIRAADHAVVAFSDGMEANHQQLKRFLFTHMYRHYRVNRMTSKAHRVIQNLFHLFLAEPQCLPTEWQAMCQGLDDSGKARVISNYIAGMTDRYALKEHQRLFDVYAVPL